MTEIKPGAQHILVTGATGYIGGRLVPYLLNAGHTVRCLAREPSRLQGRPWLDQVEVIEGDVLHPESLEPAMRDIDIAYYLIHSLRSGSDFHEADLTAACHFGTACVAAGVRRIIYLGGLAEDTPELSMHLRSRQLTGDALRECGVSVTEFQAGVVVGSGSLSFEMVRYLTERVPVMVCPRWVYTRTQPISVKDVMLYLIAALTNSESTDRVIEIGGAEAITYGQMMMIYARVRGLRRVMIPVPLLSPRLSSFWVNLVTPFPAKVARPLVEGLRNENVVRDASARTLFPEIDPFDYQTSVERALDRLDAGNIESHWSDALSTRQGHVRPLVLENLDGMILEHRQRIVAASPADIFRVFTGIGGERGWLFMDWAWEFRGFVDRLIGGVGLRRGRRDPDELRVGDVLDFWRVEAIEQDRVLRLRAEMKVPGRAWLEFEVNPRPYGKSRLRQTAFFEPKGLFGWVYWYALYPIHRIIFSGFIDEISKRAAVEPEV